MGYIKHTAAIAVGYNEHYDKDKQREIDEAWAGFIESVPEKYRALIVGPIKTLTNGDATYLFAPDGSKEGWDTSTEADEQRERFVEFAISIGWDTLDARFGGDDNGMEATARREYGENKVTSYGD